MTTSRRAWLMWSVGVTAYTVAVLQRTSLGVAGLDASSRFDVSASALASFAVVQLLVYAGLQVPLGLMLDRGGPRRLIVVGDCSCRSASWSSPSARMSASLWWAGSWWARATR